MNEVFETVAEVLEELRSEAEEREYSVHTNESENADKALKKANREYETVLPSWWGGNKKIHKGRRGGL